MKVSVCIPTYNRPDIVKEAIDSCLSQTFLPYEIIIGDDSKDDETKILISLLIKNNDTNVQIRYYKNSSSLGQLANVNRLIEKSLGEKFVLLHDDDLLLPNALQSMINCFRKFPDVNVVYGKQILINDDGSEELEDSVKLNEYFFRTKDFEGSVLSSLEAGMVQQFPNDCYMIDMDIVKKIKYGAKETVGNAGDFDFGFRLGQAGYKFYFLLETTAKYRLTSSSVARNGTDSGYQSFKLISKAKYVKSSGIDYQKIILKKKAPIAIVQALSSGRRSEAWNIYFSKWHRNKILTPGGIKRFLVLFSTYLIPDKRIA